MLEELGKPNSDKVLDSTFKRIDNNSDGVLDQAEFLKFMDDVDNAWIRFEPTTTKPLSKPPHMQHAAQHPPPPPSYSQPPALSGSSRRRLPDGPTRC